MMLADKLFATLTRFHELDPQAAHAFLLQRTAVNEAVRSDPQLPVSRLGATTVMTPLTFLNSLLIDDGKTIDAVYDTQMQLASFVLRDRVETDHDPLGVLYDFLQQVTIESHPAYVRGRAKEGDRVLITTAALARLRATRTDDWRNLTTAKTRLGVVEVVDNGYLRVKLGEPPEMTDLAVVVAEDEVKMHQDDWAARYGRPPAN